MNRTMFAVAVGACVAASAACKGGNGTAGSSGSGGCGGGAGGGCTTVAAQTGTPSSSGVTDAASASSGAGGGGVPPATCFNGKTEPGEQAHCCKATLSGAVTTTVNCTFTPNPAPDNSYTAHWEDASQQTVNVYFVLKAPAHTGSYTQADLDVITASVLYGGDN